MNQKQRTKLELIRIEGIWRMLLKKIKDESQLATWVDNVTNTSTKDARKAITRLSRYQLIKIIELAGSAITNEDIDEAYEQYRYGLKPGFTLFNIQSSKKIGVAAAYAAINSYLSGLHYGEGVNIKAITVKSHSSIDSSVIEFAFYYHIKHSYLSEAEEPSFIYEYKECFAWIDRNNGFLVIQNAPDKVTTVLKNAFVTAYSASITNIKLTRKLINEIFGNEKIKKGTFINPNASDTQAEKITLADSRFAEKQAIQQTVSGYDMTGTYLNQTVGENQPNTLGINCNKGRLYLTSNVSATVFREWSIEKIKSIITYLRSKANYENFDMFQAKNLTDLPVWNSYNVPQKKLIEQMLYAVYVAYLNHQDSADVLCSVGDLRTTMKSYFYEKLSAVCDLCDEPFIPHCDCGGTLKVSKNGSLRCLECDQEVDAAHCDEGHRVIINGIDTVVLFPSASLLGDIKETLKNAFDMTVSGFFNISGGRLTLISEQHGYLVLPENIPELKAILDIDIAITEHIDLLKQVKSVKEKCRNSTNSTCNSCDTTNTRCCMMKLFTTFAGYRPSPHQASEFGDVSFTITLNDAQCQLMGIAKSATGKDTLTLSEASARDMIQQVLTATHDARVGIIAAICPNRFHDQLTEELRYIAKLTGKPLVVLDEKYMIHQYKAYQEKPKSVS